MCLALLQSLNWILWYTSAPPFIRYDHKIHFRFKRAKIFLENLSCSPSPLRIVFQWISKHFSSHHCCCWKICSNMVIYTYNSYHWHRMMRERERERDTPMGRRRKSLTIIKFTNTPPGWAAKHDGQNVYSFCKLMPAGDLKWSHKCEFEYLLFVTSSSRQTGEHKLSSQGSWRYSRELILDYNWWCSDDNLSRDGHFGE